MRTVLHLGFFVLALTFVGQARADHDDHDKRGRKKHTSAVITADVGHTKVRPVRAPAKPLPPRYDWRYERHPHRSDPGLIEARREVYEQRKDHEQIVRKRTGCFLRLTLFWRVEEPLEEDYYVSVQPLGGEIALAKDDHLALMRGYLPTSEIEPGEIVRDEVDLLIRDPLALAGVNLVVNLYQVQGDQFPTYGQVTVPLMVGPDACR